MINCAAQALGKLSDAQNSALRLVLAKAAYETAWDNPSQLGKSLETAKNSVIERTEKLVLGTAGPAQPATTDPSHAASAWFASVATKMPRMIGRGLR